MKTVIKILLSNAFVVFFFISEALCWLLALFIGGSILHPELNVRKPFDELTPMMTEIEAITTSIVFIGVLMVEVYFMLRILKFKKQVQVAILIIAFVLNTYFWSDISQSLCSDPYLWILFNRFF